MRVIKKSLDSAGAGSVTLFPEEPEDMWHAFNLILPGDLLRAPAIRRVTTESSTGSTSSSRVHTTFTIRVASVDFDPHAGELHIGGRVAEENQYTKLGAHHTLDLELNRNFTLEKADGWDSVAITTLREATDPSDRAELVAVVMQEGLANICLVTEHQTILRQRIESAIPRKRRADGGDDHDKGLGRFFALVLATLTRHADLTDTRRPILLASPGFTAQAFEKYILDGARTNNDKALLANRANIVVAHSSSGHVHSLNEVLASPALRARLSDTRYAQETRILDEFFTLLRKDDGRAWYGPGEVERAVEKGAVGRGGGVLLISNALFRSQEVGVRRRWVRCVDTVKGEGGDVRVLSSAHESGKRIDGLGGVAAILTFPLEDLDASGDDIDEENESEQVHPNHEGEEIQAI